jgi:TonB family protein
MLDKAALDALRKWKFEPPTLNGKPVEVLCTILTRFTMK